MKKIVLLIALLLISISAIGQVHLIGRSVVGNLPRPSYNVEKEGKVVVAITVDQYGNVTQAVPGADGTTVTDQELWAAARKAAMESHFSKSNDSTPTQGTITYNFINEGSSSTARVQTIPVQQNPVYSESIDENAIKFLGIPVDGSKDRVIHELELKGFASNSSYESLSGQFNGDPVRIIVHTYHDKVDRIIVEFDKVPEMNLREQYNHLLSLLMKNDKYHPYSAYSPLPADEDCNYELFVHNKDYKVVFNYIPDGEVWLTILDRGGYHVCLYYDNLKNRPHGEDL